MMLNRRVAVSILVLHITLLPSSSALAQGRSNTQHGMPSEMQPNSSSLAPDPMNPGFGSGQIRGTVRTTDGRTLPDAMIEARDYERGTLQMSAHSDATGTFTLSNLPVGKYEITAHSGVDQASERVEVRNIGDTTVELRLSGKASAAGSNESSISFAQYKVPAKARSLYEKASQLMVRGKTDQALEKANAAIANFPKFSEALTLRGIIQERAGKTEAAISDYRTAIQSDPNYALAYITLASALNSTGHFAESVEYLDHADRIAPNKWQTSYEYARASLGKFDFKAALRSIDRASELRGGPEKESPEMHLVRGYALIGLSNLSKARDEIQAFLTREPNGRNADAAREVLSKIREENKISANR